MNLGSKMLLDATHKMDTTASGGKYPPRDPSLFFARTGKAPEDARNIDLRIREWKMLEDVLLVVKLETLTRNVERESPPAVGQPSPALPVSIKTIGREVIEKLIAESNLERLPKGIKIVAAVSEDVNLESDLEIIWGIFTRFDAARDVCFTRSKLAGATVINEGIMGIDATWKPGYPNPCVMPEEVVKKVDSRWREYGFR
jgi:4-hydroxy-3-polyprenylbenzoate decarboxylase